MISKWPILSSRDLLFAWVFSRHHFEYREGPENESKRGNGTELSFLEPQQKSASKILSTKKKKKKNKQFCKQLCPQKIIKNLINSMMS